MTKVQKHFRLARPIGEDLMGALAATNSIYGIERIQIGKGGTELMVEFDATRLRSADVESALERAGVPVSGLV